MNKQICTPRISFSTSYSTAFLIVLVLLASAAALGQTNPQGQETLAAAAQSQVGPNQQVQLEGELEITYQDFKDQARLSYSLKRPDGTRVPLHFTKEPPTHLLTGDHVRANGQLSGGSLILYSGSTSLTKTAPTSNAKPGPAPPPQPPIPVPNTFGAQSTLVMLVNFQDDAVEPYTVADAQTAFFVTANNFFMENSYGQTSLTGDVVGWYTIPDSVTACNTGQIATDAKSAAVAAGVNLSNYTRYVYAFPLDNACGFGGASDVGGNPSESWINGTTGPGGTTLNVQVIDHELGHAFGLWHSHSLSCGTTATNCSGGTVIEYGDIMDTMGAPQTASPEYNAFQKERLGWLNYAASPSIQTVSSSGTYTIYPYELSSSGPNALKVLQSTNSTTGAKTWYYLESRQAVGFDAFLTDSVYYTQNETNGLLFHLGTDGNSNGSELLDMTPATPTASSWFDASLAVGQSFADATAGVTFTPTAVGSTGATVQVTFGSCIPANPNVSVSPSQSQYVTAGTPVTFTVSVKDNDSSSCAATTLNLSGTAPSGWAGVWGTSALSLSPGKNGSATLTMTSPLGTADGSYYIGVSATNTSANSYSGSATATYAINSAPLSVSLTTNQSSYLPGQTVGISVTMLYGTLPDAGASVKVTVTPPNGKVTTLTGTSGINGVALFSYKLSKGAPAGTYQVQLGTTAGGTTSPAAASSTTGASTSFTVQ